MNDFWSPLKKVINQMSHEFDKFWLTRQRLINTQFLVMFILKLVLSKNHQGYKILLNELWETNEFSSIQTKPVAASSICEARQKMPETIFTSISKQILLLNEQSNPLPLWRGHRVFGVDGSKINVPHELINYGYKAPNRNQYYPQAVLSTLYHLGSGLIYEGIMRAGKSERTYLLEHMDQLAPGDVLVLDRGYFSYLILSLAIKKGLHLICRMQSGTVNKAVQAFFDGNTNDETISYIPSIAVKYESRKKGFEVELNPIKLRLIKYTIGSEIYVCATTLFGENYPANEFQSVYHGRWGIEELYKISKSFLEVEDFHSKTERGVRQECYAHLLLINLARIFELETNKQFPPSDNNTEHKIPVEQKDGYWQDFCGEIQKLKINFKNCILVIGRNLEKLICSVTDQTVEYLGGLIESIGRVRQRIRPGRHTKRESRRPLKKWSSSNGGNVAHA
jgi:hypothetical protein